MLAFSPYFVYYDRSLFIFADDSSMLASFKKLNSSDGRAKTKKTKEFSLWIFMKGFMAISSMIQALVPSYEKMLLVIHIEYQKKPISLK